MKDLSLFDFSADLEWNSKDIELIGKHTKERLDAIAIGSNKLCMWVGEECAGEIKSIEVVKGSGQFTEICERHLQTHEEIMLCVQGGFNIDKIVEWSHEERKRVVGDLAI